MKCSQNYPVSNARRSVLLLLVTIVSICYSKFIITPERQADEGYFPGYNHELMKIFDISDRQYEQRLILQDDRGPAFMTNGGSIALGWKPYFNETTAVSIYCTQRVFLCYWTLFTHHPNATTDNWLPNHHSNSHVFYPVFQNSPRGFHQFVGEDPRLILTPSKTRLLIIFNKQVHYADRSAFRTSFCAELTYDPSDHSMYLSRHPVALDISHKLGRFHEKNWSPFFYLRKEKRMSRTATAVSDETFDLCFIHSSDPHRILRLPEQYLSIINPPNISTSYWATSPTINVTVASDDFVLTNATRNAIEHWKWGLPIRGGTHAEMVRTPFGRKYLTVFHTSGHVLQAKISTYFMGIYLFDCDPPFAMTHISREPIISNSMYNDTFGWCTRYGQPDYCVFPVGLAIDASADRVYVSWGKNNKESWMLSLNWTHIFNDHLIEIS